MIHRIDSVNPDVDDRVIKPNQARAALNLRFGSSTNDTSLSGGILVRGNEQIPYTFPEEVGDYKVVGVKEDYENQCVYFAMRHSYAVGGSGGTHGIYRITASTNKIEAIVTGSWLYFLDDVDVSMCAIGGLLYWTDGRNQPRVINIEKGIRTELSKTGVPVSGPIYPARFVDWYYTQIKRPPALPIQRIQGTPQNVFSLNNASTDFLSDFTLGTNVGYQFSYYYTYWDNEESRLAPVSELMFVTKTELNGDMMIGIPSKEWALIHPSIAGGIVRYINIVIRDGNDGAWFDCRRLENDTQLGLDNPSDDYLTTVFNNLSKIPRTPTSDNITSAQFDSVPLTSTCNVISQNRIFHSNYLIDYDNWDGLTLSLTPNKQEFQDTSSVKHEALFRNNITFVFGNYRVGVELLDEFGRRIAVVASTLLNVPRPTIPNPYNFTLPLTNDQANAFNPTFFGEDALSWTNYTYQVYGNFPSWAKYYRIVYTKCLDYNYFHKSVCKLYFWYTSRGVDYFANYAGNINSNFAVTPIPDNNMEATRGEKFNYIFQGFAVELSSGEPFEYNKEDNQHILISREYNVVKTTLLGKTAEFSAISNSPFIEYKIEKAVNNLLCFRAPINAGLISTVMRDPLTAGNATTDATSSHQFMVNRIQLYYQVYLYSKTTQENEVYYQNSAINEIKIDPFTGMESGTTRTGIIYGDCYAAKFKKTNGGSSLLQLNAFWSNEAYVGVLVGEGAETNRLDPYVTVDRVLEGYAFSMNPTNIYSQSWNSSIGQLNIVNQNQKSVRLKNWITYSDTILLGSETNGLNKFNSIDSQAMPAENGPITALVITNAQQGQPGVMLAIGALGIESIYLGAIQQVGSDGESVMSLSTNVLGSHRPLMGQYGTKNIRSISTTPMSTIYWWSEVVNDLIRYTNAGLERLGQTYMFSNAARISFQNSPSVTTVYDQVTDEIILMGVNSDSFVFSERFKTFQGKRELWRQVSTATFDYPERAISLSTQVYMFLNGQVWVSVLDDRLDNNFFGKIHSPKLTIITNETPTSMKLWTGYKLFGPSKPPVSTILTSGSNEGSSENQISEIDPGWWIERKQDWEVAIRRDSKSTGGILSGKLMESRILNTTFVFDVDGFQKLNFIEVRSNKSVVQ